MISDVTIVIVLGNDTLCPYNVVLHVHQLSPLSLFWGFKLDCFSEDLHISHLKSKARNFGSQGILKTKIGQVRSLGPVNHVRNAKEKFLKETVNTQILTVKQLYC